MNLTINKSNHSFQFSTNQDDTSQNPAVENKPCVFKQAISQIKNAWLRIDPSWKTGTLTFLLTRFWLTLLGTVLFFQGWVPQLCKLGACNLYWGMNPVVVGWKGALLGMWQRWDTLHYQVIASTGYSNPVETAFFPGYPLLAHAIAWIFHISDLAALILVSNVFCWLSFVLLYQVAHSLFNELTAKRSVLFLAIFPTSFFLFGGYPQSMILFFTLFCYWQAKQNRWLLAALTAFIAGLTHGTVIPLCLMLAWQAFKSIRRTRLPFRWSISLVPFFPLAGIALFLVWRKLQAFAPYGWVQSVLHERTASLPWITLINEYKILTSTNGFSMWLNFIFLVFILLVAIWSIWKLPFELKIFSVASFLFFLFTSAVSDPLKSINRFSLMIFPVYIMLAEISTRKIIRLFVMIFSAILFSLLSIFFFMWGWVG